MLLETLLGLLLEILNPTIVHTKGMNPPPCCFILGGSIEQLIILAEYVKLLILAVKENAENPGAWCALNTADDQSPTKNSVHVWNILKQGWEVCTEGVV